LRELRQIFDRLLGAGFQILYNHPELAQVPPPCLHRASAV
jgi:hypothetical protein